MASGWKQPSMDYENTKILDSSKGFRDLPDELLIKIFSYLTFDDLVHSVQYVSNRWQEVSRDFELWARLSYCPSWRETDEKISDVLKETSNLESLDLAARAVRSIVLNTFVDKCPKLKRLQFNKCQGLSKGLLKTILQKCPDIEILSVPNVVVNNKSKADIIGRFNKLKFLYIVGRAENQLLYLKRLADGCPALQAIDLEEITCSYEDLEYFISKKKHQLHALFVSWSSENEKCTIPLLEDCKNLKELCIYSYCDVEIQLGFDSLRQLKCVTSLTLCLLNNADINYVMEVFDGQAMSQLVDLNISFYECYEDRLADVIVKNCPKLKSLSIEACVLLTDQSVVGFQTLPELQCVDLFKSSITDEGVVHLSKCKNLRYLNLNSCSMLTGRNLVSGFPALEFLCLNLCDISCLPLNLLPYKLKHLKVLSINYCKNVNLNALKELKEQMPQLCICDSFERYNSLQVNEIEPADMDSEVDFIDSLIFQLLQVH